MCEKECKFSRIIDLRKDRGLIQEDIAKLLHIHQTGYSKYETGENCISIDVLCILADFYGTSTDYLLERTDEIKPYPKSKRKKHR